MTLYEYMEKLEEGTEVAVIDNDYDVETYFYNDMNYEDEWDKSMIALSKILTISEVIDEERVSVNISELIEKHIDELKQAGLFIRCTLDAIMYDIEQILSGYVSEEWLKKFVDILKIEVKEGENDDGDK